MDARNIRRALRLPFISASMMPFCAGSLCAHGQFSLPAFLVGLATVVSVHLSANLINDYADSRSGADWNDTRFYGFFGGSKLIQEKVLPEQVYLKGALFFAGVSCACVVALAVILKSLLVVGLYCGIFILSWAYSMKPFMLSYRRLGEVVIFVLFGPVPVMGGYFIQTGRFPAGESFLLSLPFGFMTTAVLFANEVPDYPQDRMVGKNTLVSISGQKNAFMLYGLMILLCFGAIVFDVTKGILGPAALFSLLCVPLAFKAARILRRDYESKEKLVDSSRLTISFQMFVGMIIIFGVIALRTCRL